MKQTKVFQADNVEINLENREVIACISSAAVDRDGEVVLPSGLKKSQYGGNPVVLFGHDNNSLPIGTTRWIKQDGNKILAKYYVSDKTQFSRDVFGLLQDGVLKAHSIGFMDLESSPPNEKDLETNPEWKDANKIIRSWELLEFSVVNVPANPEALAISVAKSCTPETCKFFGVEPTPDCVEWEEEKSFAHNSKVDKDEPDWGSVDKTKLPREAFADKGKEDEKSTWKYPHHWVKGGGSVNDDGVYTDGTMFLHAGGLNAAWSAANGGRSGQEASPAVKAHLQAHRKALGLDKQVEQPKYCRAWKDIEKQIMKITSPEEIINRLKGKI